MLTLPGYVRISVTILTSWWLKVNWRFYLHCADIFSLHIRNFNILSSSFLCIQFLHISSCFLLFIYLPLFYFIYAGTESGIKLYLKEIISLCEESLTHQSWSRKAQAARALKVIASKLKSNLQAPHVGSILSVLLEGLNGRTYDGKEELLRAMTTICISCRLVTDTQQNDVTWEKFCSKVFVTCVITLVSYCLLQFHFIA